jgi:hypothetical protein
MTGPEFALSIIASMIAAVLYDMLRNPSPPGFKKDSATLLEQGKYLLRKAITRETSAKKNRTPAELNNLDDSTPAIHRATFKKFNSARLIESPPNICQSCEYISACEPTVRRAFLKTAFS